MKNSSVKVPFSSLTMVQRKQAILFHEDALKKREIVINQMSFSVNPWTGNLIFRKGY